MKNQQATITATFREGTLFLIENSTNLGINPREQYPIVDYLNALVQRGWRITQAVFDGFTLRLELEETGPDPNPNARVFLFHSFSIATYGLPGEQNYHSSTSGQKALSEKFKEAIRADGWQELCTSNVLRTTGYWILSLWMR